VTFYDRTIAARDVLIKPVVSEKSYGLINQNVYTFIVHPGANKSQIKDAVEHLFEVKVTSVNTLNRPGKRKRTRTGFGKRKDTKRAIVTIDPAPTKPGLKNRIDIVGGPVG
jgi:large subunit ribosomal protein L23